jgi:RNA polymerase sigma-70 factor, ECF subfamily
MVLTPSDSELVRAARAGDGGAFAELVRPQYRTAFRLAYGLLHDVDEAEDAVQEASFKAWRRLTNLRAGSPLRPWFLGIVANECRSVRRSKRWSTRAQAEPPEGMAEPADVAASVDLRRSLARLGDDDRLVLVLRYYLDLPFDEIAATLGLTPTAARSRVDRAVRRLRPMLRLQEVVP